MQEMTYTFPMMAVLRVLIGELEIKFRRLITHGGTTKVE